MFKKVIHRLRDTFVKLEVNQIKIPHFIGNMPIIRKKIIFSGKVQHIGFRLEASLISKRIGLTGFVSNLENGDVLVECQGSLAQIETFLHVLNQVKRFHIAHTDISEIPTLNEREFLIK